MCTYPITELHRQAPFHGLGTPLGPDQRSKCEGKQGGIGIGEGEAQLAVSGPVQSLQRQGRGAATRRALPALRRVGVLRMSGEVLPRVGSPAAALVPTRLNRELTRIEQSAIVRAHKVQAVNYVGTVALNAAAQLSATQVELAKLTPDSEMRLAAIADAAAAAIHATVLRTGIEP